jgi:hypothetical protein
MTDVPDADGPLPSLDPELAAWLRSEPVPTMPPHVWSRLEAALAAEPAVTGVVNLETARRRRRSRAALPLLAGAAGLVLVGAVVIPSLRGNDPTPVADGVSVIEPAGTLPSPAEGAVSADAGATATGPPPQGGVPQSTAAEPRNSDSVESTLPRAMMSSGIAYTEDAMPSQVVTLLSAAGLTDSSAMSSAMSAEPSANEMPGTGLGSSPAMLADCLDRLGLPEGATPLILDTATFDGERAGVIVAVGATTDGAPRDLHVVAVGWKCDAAAVAKARHWDLPLPELP